MRILMLAALPLAVTACAALPAAERPPVPPSLLAPAAAPVALPDRALAQAEVEILWGRDRTALRQCGGQIDGLARWVTLTP